MVSGPLGVRRPFSSYRLIIDTRAPTISIQPIGPFGLPRPFAHNNPPVTEDRIAECVVSDAGQSFGAGSVSMGETTDISELPPDAQEEALDRAEKWCEGVMEATSDEGLERGDPTIALASVREQVRREQAAPPGTEFDLQE